MIGKWLGTILGIKPRRTVEILLSPLSGKVMRLADVPDPVFSAMPAERGIAVEPTEGIVLSPVDGEVVGMFASKHAVAIRTESGVEVIVHIGLDTITMRGEGFQAFVRIGDRVAAGQPLIEFSPELVKRKATSTVTLVIIANPDSVAEVEFRFPEHAEAGVTPLMRIRSK